MLLDFNHFQAYLHEQLPKKVNEFVECLREMQKESKKFLAKVHLLLKTDSFALNKQSNEAFPDLKHDLASAGLASVRGDFPFQIESGASGCVVVAILSQGGGTGGIFIMYHPFEQKKLPLYRKRSNSCDRGLEKINSFFEKHSIYFLC